MTRRRPDTLAEFTEWAGERYADHPALRFKRPAGEGAAGDGSAGDGGWQSVSYTQLRDVVRETGRVLIGGLGVAPGDRVAILSETRPAWTYAHFAAFAAGAVVVPVYPTAGDEELAWVLGDSGASVVICENAAQAARVEGVRGGLPALRHVVRMDALPGVVGADAPARAGGSGAPGAPPVSAPPVSASPPGPAPASPTPAPLAELLDRCAAVRVDDPAEIVYTSGTTGPPKGCLLTHANIAAVLDANLDLIEGGPGDRTYLYLPLAHLLAQLIEFTTVLHGSELCYFGGRIEDVVGELAEVGPTHLPSVPRLFEKIHSVVLSLAEAQEGGRERFTEAVRIGVLAADGQLPEVLKGAYEEADQRLYSLVRAAFGGRLRWALTGAAPIAPQTLDFLRACGIAVFEGYGMTESGGAISLNHPGAVRYGTVGRPIAGCEVRIGEDGEVLARGPMVFSGYYGNEQATRETLDEDGWLHTGDLGALDEDGYLSITGRKKDLIITSSGKNLTPSQVELAVQQSRFVSHAVLVGDRRPYPVALITLDPDEVTGWAARTGHDPADRDAVRTLVQEAVDTANAQVSRPARIRAFAVLDEDFTVDSGVLTPTLKVRRKAVTERYAGVIEALYAEG